MQAGQGGALNNITLSARGLAKSFGSFKAVSGVDLDVERGSIHALIGPNGAGKTTCFNLLTKFLQPSEGTITYEGADITHESPAAIARRGMVRSFQISAVFPHMTALHNVRVALQRKDSDSFDFWNSGRRLARYDAGAMSLLEAVGLGSFAGTEARELSYGRKRALEIATTLALDPKILLLDEPMAGMGREDVDRIAQLIKSLAGPRTILMVEHNLSVVAELSHRITVLARGQVLAEGDYATVSSDPKVIEAYIGTGGGHAH